jgi:hypothetical protein
MSMTLSPRVLLFVPLMCACGGAPARVVTVDPVRAQPDPPPVTPPSTQVGLHPLYEEKVSGDVRGIALDGAKLLVNVSGKLLVYDAHGPVAASKPTGVVAVVGDETFDVGGQGALSPSLPKALQCEGKTFSLDGAKMSSSCRGPQGEEITIVFDGRTGAELGVYKEFQTAAPIRAGTITQSGNFIFWVARANGAFEEIKSHVTGPMMTSHSVMSPDEGAIFTAIDKHWYSEDRSPTKVLDPHDARVLFTLPVDVDTVFFSPSGHLLAAHHSKNWGDIMHTSEKDTTTLTIHKMSADVLAAVPGDDAVEAAFSRDDAHFAARYASGTVRVYSLR